MGGCRQQAAKLGGAVANYSASLSKGKAHTRGQVQQSLSSEVGLWNTLQCVFLSAHAIHGKAENGEPGNGSRNTQSWRRVPLQWIVVLPTVLVDKTSSIGRAGCLEQYPKSMDAAES
mmetsp:Transcript_10382/g.30554  ORF Transcript_10382/g.30554 Transcript_10382/m.30554 type:complete len:117 (-) Transcript_10382:298-648(-)